jgi:hypothetical protein
VSPTAARNTTADAASVANQSKITGAGDGCCLASNPVAPTVFRRKPFGENVEGLFHCGIEIYVIEAAVQKHDFEDSTLGGGINDKPLLSKRLKKFKNIGREGCRFVLGAVEHSPSLPGQVGHLPNVSTMDSI